MAKKLNKASIELVKQITEEDDPSSARSVLQIFVQGVEEGHRLDVILDAMAEEVKKEIEG